MITLRKPEAQERSGVRSGLGTRLAMFGLALIGLVGMEGCQSSGCNGCGVTSGVTGFTQKVGQGFSNLTARVFHRNKYAAGSECCEGGAVVTDPGIPMGTTIPGPIIQGPIGGGSSSGGTEVSPELSPATPSSTSKPGAAGSKEGALRLTPLPGNARMSYETERPVVDGPRSRSGRENVARSLLSQAGNTGSPSSSALDNLPPVDLPKDVARRANSAPVPLEAEALVPPASLKADAKDQKKPAAAAPPAVTPLLAPSSASAAEPPSATFELPPVKAALDKNVSPGIQRFTAVGPSLAGGSAPNKEGLDWLKDKGYRTFLDLREHSEIDPAFMDEVINRGLRYVPLPLNVNRLDEVRVNRFREELAQQDARPLYFCDQDGSRSAMLWYVHRVTDDGVDLSMAKREADEIAPLTDSLMQTATRFIGTRTGSATKPVARIETSRDGAIVEPSNGNGALAIKVEVAPEDESLLGRSAVLTFTRYEGAEAVKIPEPKSVSLSRPMVPVAPASQRVSERNRSVDRPASGE